ncbi:hypothetical protein LEM8419_03291 [Neolewinella maritima]|uniref:T9SS type A sorting domain-containing protein n=1 Tax=Neolewinella maritima TaxID=1383882 RepID=A0ABM9B544_9BACT|nr:hypothetical protein [Neolewinella maritima]CAH1002396.1 hypothetical protein LEM8419_03291 [Neolewinella maritima]
MKSFFFLALLCTSVPALAHTEVTDTDALVARTQVDAFELNVQLINLQGQRAVITLQQLDGTTGYQTRVKEHNGYTLTLQLDEVPAGRYLLTVKQGKTVRRQVVVKSAAGILCSEWK